MKKNNWDFLQLKKVIEDENRPLICYGAGMVARHIGYLLKEYGLLNRIIFWVDGNRDKINLTIEIEGRKFSIREKEILRDSQYENAVILITCESEEEIIHSLLRDRENTPKDCCSCLYAINKLISHTVSMESPIPKIIHYCWFGSKEIPAEQKRFIEEWKQICPDYEFYFWNEFNYDLSKCRYVSEAYKEGCYAFVTDYVRMDVVYQYGGIYFDTDVRLIKNIDFLRQYDAFFTYGKWPAINSGSGFGAAKGHELIKEIRDNPRGTISFYKGGKCNKMTNCYYETEIIRKYGFRMDFTSQNIGNVQIFSPGYFPTYTYSDSYGLIGEDVIAIHYDAGSWRQRCENETIRVFS